MALVFGAYDLDGDLDIFAPGDTGKPMFEQRKWDLHGHSREVRLDLSRGDLFGIHSVAASFADL